MDRECNYCGEPFIPTRKDNVFCSKSHKAMFAREGKKTVTAETVTNQKTVTLLKKVTCRICNAKIERPRLYQKFCSQKCRDKSVDKINELLKERGLPPVIKGSDYPQLEFVSSGIKEIDDLTQGFPRKRVTEIFGLKGVGKTQLMSRIINGLPDLKIYYVDAENALKSPPANVEVFDEFLLERVQESIEVALQADYYDLVVIDSVAALTPNAELEGDPGDTHMGLKARQMSQWMRRINFWLHKSPQTAVVFINQQRETMNQFGALRFTPGGLALGYASSLRLELRSNKADKKENFQWVEVIVEKSRFSKPYTKTKFKLSYD